MQELFKGLEDFRFVRHDLKYFPLPFLCAWVEPRWGFFLTMTARKPVAVPQKSAAVRAAVRAAAV